jgi:hypothetical protein
VTVLTPNRPRRHDKGEFAGRTEHYFPDANEEGFYVLADPKRGSEKHHQKNAIYIRDISFALHLVRTYGFAIRMRGDLTKQWNLIRAEEIEFL